MAKRFIEEFDSGWHNKYLLYYHLVIVTKYRKKVLDGDAFNVVRACFYDLSEEFGVHLEEMNGEADHVHILFRAEPTTDLSRFIGRLKGKSSYICRQRNEELREMKALWSGSYCLLTTGGAPIDIVKRYIQSQGNRD